MRADRPCGGQPGHRPVTDPLPDGQARQRIGHSRPPAVAGSVARCDAPTRRADRPVHPGRPRPPAPSPAHRGRAPRRRRRAGLGVAAGGRPPRRDRGRGRPRRAARLPAVDGRRPRGRVRSIAAPAAAGARLPRAHPRLRGPRPRRRRPRGARRRARRVRGVVLTNAAGGIREGMLGGPAGAHQPTTSTSPGCRPLAGPTAGRRRVGTRFVDLTDAYSPRLRAPGPRGRPVADRGRLRRRARAALRDAGGDPLLPHARRRPGGHVDGARDDRRPPGRRRGAGAVAGHQPGRRPVRRAARPRRGPRGRARRPPSGWATCWPTSSAASDDRRRRPASPRPGPGATRTPTRRPGPRSTACSADGGERRRRASPSGSAPGSSSAPPGCGARSAPGPTA